VAKPADAAAPAAAREIVMKLVPIAVGACLLAFHLGAAATEVAYFSEPQRSSIQKISLATNPKAYRVDAARHIYEAYASRIYKGRLPPLIHGVVVVETTVDESGHTRDVKVVRGPSHAPDVTQAVVEMIHRASPMPLHRALSGNVKFLEIWLVHKDGRFQLDALTEGED
jgi:TonB family protein